MAKKINPKRLKRGQFCKYKGRIYQRDADYILQQLTGKDKGAIVDTDYIDDGEMDVTPIKVKIVEVKQCHK